MDYSLPPKRCLLFCSEMNKRFRADPLELLEHPRSVKRVERLNHGKKRL